ncbi:MAG: pullulanase [Rhodobacteraceae bacterium]|nr:pullulanase [Paracoccaceae bacterium]
MAENALRTRDREMIPRALLRAVAALVAISMALTIYARVTDRPLEAMPAPHPIAEEREVRIFARMDGSARVFDVDGTLIADLDPTQGGFIAGVSRALGRERIKHGVEASAPVRLIRYQGAGMALRDDATGWRAELTGFGPDNERAFMRLMRNY